jgi:hypothetical protein
MAGMLSDFEKYFNEFVFGHYILRSELFISELLSFLGQKCGSQGLSKYAPTFLIFGKLERSSF